MIKDLECKIESGKSVAVLQQKKAPNPAVISLTVLPQHTIIDLIVPVTLS